MLWRSSPSRSRRSPPTGFIRPCQPILVDHPPADPDWLHEVKHDGYRIIARKEEDRATLWTRHGTNFTDRLPKIAEAVRRLPVERALIDGEAVAFRPDGHCDLAALRTKAGASDASLVAFDLLTLNDEDYRQRPLEERREALSGMVAGIEGLVFSEAIEADGAIVFAKACEMGLERESSRSAPEVVIGAARAGNGSSRRTRGFRISLRIP